MFIGSFNLCWLLGSSNVIGFSKTSVSVAGENGWVVVSASQNAVAGVVEPDWSGVLCG